MPAWTNELPSQPEQPGFTLRRTPPDRPLRAVVTCNDLNVCLTHFWGGRTMPCEKPQCDACNAMSPKRAHVYLSAYDLTNREHFIFECTAPAAEPFRDWKRDFTTLRGCLFQASRPKRRRNAQVEILTKPCDLTKITLPLPPDVALAMAVIWRLPQTACSSRALNSIEAAIDTDADVADRMRICPADFANAEARQRKNGSTS
jgi:hypothetical protein